jgi:hypothetical protein
VNNDHTIGGLLKGQEQIERRLGGVDVRLDKIERRLDSQDMMLLKIHDGIYAASSAFKWLLRLGIGGGAISVAFNKALDWFHHGGK